MTSPAPYRWNKAWIIGASTGIGHALAKRIAPRCKTVVVSARSTGKLEALARDHMQLEPQPVDVTDAAAIAALAARIDSGDDPVDLVVISSGVWHPVKAGQFDIEKFKDAVDVNFMGVINVLAAIVPPMVARGSGHIAIISSASAYRGLPNAAAYSPMKAALLNLTESIYPQLKRAGVHISIIVPGFVDTPLTAVNKFPMPFLMSAEEAARRIARGLEQKRYEIAFPNRFIYLLKLMRMLPNSVFFWYINKFVLK